jgi:type II secretory pathway component PulC
LGSIELLEGGYGMTVLCWARGMVLALLMMAALFSPFLALGATNSTGLDKDYIVEHNIFSPDRKYTPEASKGSKAVASGSLKLVGIIMVGDLKEAVISIKGANPPVVILKEGEEANGCKVVNVTSKEVVVERNGKRETLLFEEDQNPFAQSPVKEGEDHKIAQKEEEAEPETKGVEKKAKENPFFKILESVRKSAKKRGKKAPPPIFPFH